jgi:hypothetical protein
LEVFRPEHNREIHVGNSRLVISALVTLGLATAMHVDWHVARPVVHHLSLGWRWHWVFAVPVFALSGWYVLRAWPTRPVGASLAILGVASLLAAVVEPSWEYWVEGASFDWAFGRVRLVAFGAFVAVGTVTHVAVLRFARRRS